MAIVTVCVQSIIANGRFRYGMDKQDDCTDVADPGRDQPPKGGEALRFGIRAVLVRFRSGGTSSGSSSDRGRVPPQAAITSLGVTASGSKLRVMRFAEMV